jgi:hypothetical protein
VATAELPQACQGRKKDWGHRSFGVQAGKPKALDRRDDVATAEALISRSPTIDAPSTGRCETGETSRVFHSQFQG